MNEPALAAISVGLDKLRASWGYKQTVKRAKSAGVSFASTALGRAESSLMVSPPTYASVKKGRDLLHGSWAWAQTKKINPVNAMFQRTLMGQADTLFAQAQKWLTPQAWGVFAANGVQCIAPDGGTEDSEHYRAAGFMLASYNVGDHLPESWDNWHRRMAQGGIVTGPWARCRKREDSVRLCEIAEAHGERYVIHNVERELESANTVPMIADVVRLFPGIQHALQPEPWIQNSVRLGPLTALGVIVLVEAYMNADPRFLPSDLANHARDLEAGLVGATFGAGTWSDAPYNIPPSTYFAHWPTGPYWVYPIDSKDPAPWKRP